ncbi:MAG: SH3 domain-containing protein [Proteobacteria bacterium]|nr:SH3 domain-containing protein [Pseudomonadota bacterium]
MKTLILTLAAASALSLTGMAQASPAYLVQDTELMAGPDQGYPLLDDLLSGDEVDVQGCTDGYYWCDVIADGERGWVPGNALQLDDGDQMAPLPNVGYDYGVPIVVFAIQPYWNAYYSGYPFFVQRWTWYQWAPPYRPPMPPRVVPLPHPIFNPPPRDIPPPHPIPNPPPRDIPPPHPIPNPPPRDIPPPQPIFNPPPRDIPPPHPIPNPPPHDIPPPQPIFNPPPRDVPPPQPVFNPPPRVVPLPQPIPGPRMRVASTQRPPAAPRAPRPAAPRSGGGGHHRH